MTIEVNLPKGASIERRTVAILALAFGVVMLDRMVQLFLGPELVTAFNLTGQQIGLLAAAMSVSWGISSFLFGMVSDQIGRKRVLVPAMVIFSILSCFSGLAPTFEELLICRVLLGLAEGPCFSVIMALVKESSSVDTRGRNIGATNSMGPLVGAAIAPVFATQIAAAFGWREAFFLAAIPGFILAFLVWKFVPEPERANDQSDQSYSKMASLFEVMRYPQLWACFLGAFLLGSWIFSITVFAPLYLTRVQGLSGTTAGFLMAATGLGGFLSSIFWPTVSDRLGRKKVLLILGGLAAMQPLVAIWGSTLGGSWVTATLLLITATGPAIAALVMILLPSEAVPRRLSATAIGFAVMGAEVFGATLAPLLGGALADSSGLSAPLYLAVGAGLGIMIIGGLMKTHREVTQSQTN